MQQIRALIRQGQQSVMVPPKKKAFLFLGNTGAGQTTFINYFFDQNSVKLKECHGDYTLNNADTNSKFHIGETDTQSTTIFPQFLDYEGNLLIDTAGYLESRDVSYEIAQGMFLKHIFNNCEVHIVLVISKGDRDNAKGNVMKRFVNFINNLIDGTQYRDCISILFTKFENTSKESIASWMKKNFFDLYDGQGSQQVEEQKETDKIVQKEDVELLKFIFQKKRYAFFQSASPDNIDNLTNEDTSEIFKNAKFAQFNNVQIEISLEGMNAIDELSFNLIDKLSNIVRQKLKYLKKKFKNDLKIVQEAKVCLNIQEQMHVRYLNKQDPEQFKLKDFVDCLDSKNEKQDFIDALETIEFYSFYSVIVNHELKDIENQITNQYSNSIIDVETVQLLLSKQLAQEEIKQQLEKLRERTQKLDQIQEEMLNQLNQLYDDMKIIRKRKTVQCWYHNPKEGYKCKRGDSCWFRH